MPNDPFSFDVLYEDNHLLVVNKPAGLPTMGVAKGKPSLLGEAKSYIAHKYSKPGNVYLGVVSRLDAPVTGIVVIARTSKAAGRLSSTFRERRVQKIYRALVTGVPDPTASVVEHYLRKDERHRRVHVTHANCPGAQQARLQYQALTATSHYAQLEIRLETGRKHQIRVQLAKLGHPILGDLKYGSPEAFSPGIALHSYHLELPHPVRDELLRVTCDLPNSWQRHSAARQLMENSN